MNSAADDFSKGALDILWSLWSTLGAYLTSEQTRSVVVDPEAALVGACGVGRADPRLFDEVLDWLVVNHRLIKTERVTRFVRDSTEDTARAVAAVADYTSGVVGHEFLQGIVRREEGVARRDAEEADLLFRRSAFDAGTGAVSGKPDKKFLGWGFKRSVTELRNHSGTPDLDNPANVMLLLRAHYGKSARADTLAYLLTGQPGSSYEIARMTGYNQSTVYRELAAMSLGGPVKRQGAGKGTRFWIDRNKLAASLWHRGRREIPVFFNWADIFRALEDAIETLDRIAAKRLGDVLKVEACADLSERIVPLLRGAAAPLGEIPPPDLAKLRRPGGAEEVITFIEKALEVVITCVRS